jgi:hypothetical protein
MRTSTDQLLDDLSQEMRQLSVGENYPYLSQGRTFGAPGLTARTRLRGQARATEEGKRLG